MRASTAKVETVEVVGHKQVSGNGIDHEEQVPHSSMKIYKPMANVGIRMGMTQNIGDFESLKFEVSLFYPCEVECIDDAAAEVKAWCEETLDSLIKEAEKDLGQFLPENQK